MTVAKVFIAGSRTISWLDDLVKVRVDNIILNRLKVILGDANGADKAVQNYLFSKNYTNVEIFCMEGGCRNNVGNWSTRTILASNATKRDFAYYSTKDQKMADEADYGLMLWDGESRGTLRNIAHLVRQGVAVVVYLSRDQSFYTLSNPEQLHVFLQSRRGSALSTPHVRLS